MPHGNGLEKGLFHDGVAWIDGRFVPIADARISVLDWGLIRSDCTYDVVHVWDGSFFMLDAHIERFIRSCEALRLSLRLSDAEIKEVLNDCVALSGLKNSYVEIVCTRGSPRVAGSRDYRQCTSTVFAYAIPFVWLFPQDRALTGIRTIIPRTGRTPKSSVDPRVKNFQWGDFTYGTFEAYDQGVDTCILCTRDGHVAEGPGFNVFAVNGSGVITPAENVLQGVTRRMVKEICHELGRSFLTRSLSARELRMCDEAFVSTTAGGIYPIKEVDGRRLGDKCPGAVTTEVQERYWAMHKEAGYITKVRSRSRSGSGSVE